MDSKHGRYQTRRAVAGAIYGTMVMLYSIINGLLMAMSSSVRHATRFHKNYDWPIPNFDNEY